MVWGDSMDPLMTYGESTKSNMKIIITLRSHRVQADFMLTVLIAENNLAKFAAINQSINQSINRLDLNIGCCLKIRTVSYS